MEQQSKYGVVSETHALAAVKSPAGEVRRYGHRSGGGLTRCGPGEPEGRELPIDALRGASIGNSRPWRRRRTESVATEAA